MTQLGFAATIRDGIDADAADLARMVIEGTLPEGECRAHIAQLLFKSDVWESMRRPLFGYQQRYGSGFYSDLVGEVQNLIMTLCMDTTRKSHLDLDRIMDGASVCGWARQVQATAAPRIAARLATKANRELPIAPERVEVGPVHPTMSTPAAEDRLSLALDVFEEQIGRNGQAVNHRVETGTRAILSGLGVASRPRRLASRADRTAMLTALDADVRHAQTQLLLLANPNDRRPRPAPDRLVVEAVGHMHPDELETIAEYAQAADLVLRCAATPRPRLPIKDRLRLTDTVQSMCHTAEAQKAAARLVVAFLNDRAELNESEWSPKGLRDVREKTDDEAQSDRATFEHAAGAFVSETTVLGCDPAQVASTLDDILEALLATSRQPLAAAS